MIDLVAIRKFLVEVAAGEVARQLVGVAAHVIAGPAAGLLTYAKKPIEKLVIKLADKFWAWKEQANPADAAMMLSATANLSQREAKEIAESVIEEVGHEASDKDKQLGVNLLTGLVASLRQSLPRDATGKSVCPVDCLPKDRNAVLGLMPTVIPPFIPPCQLPNSPYHLIELTGMGGFGAVYKATVQGESEFRAVKVCLDPDRVDSLRNEQKRLDQLRRWSEKQSAVTAGVTNQEWRDAVVLLYGHQLEAEPYYLIYEFMPDGDLTTYFQSQRARNGGVSSDEVLPIVREIAAKLGVAHRAGIVHRDLKPTNILLKSGVFKIGDFGLGTVVDPNMYSYSRVQSSLERSQQFRGAGTPLYMSEEQANGEDDYRNDIFSLGVIWYQLLVGDFSRRIPHGWEDNLRARRVPEQQIKLLSRCVRALPDRPTNGDDLARAIDAVLNREEELAAERALKEKQEQEHRAEQERIEREKAAQQGPVKLEIAFYGDDSFGVNRDDMFVFAPTPGRDPKVYFDGKVLSDYAYLKKGFTLSVNTYTGDHELLIKWHMTMINIVADKSTNLPGEAKIRFTLERKGNATLILGCPAERCLVLDSLSYD